LTKSWKNPALFFLPGRIAKPEGAPKNYSTVGLKSQEKIAKKIDKKMLS
jgi:hypothetical protein